VETVNWYHTIAFCNKLSLTKGKEPVYRVNGVGNWEGLAYNAIPTSSDKDWDNAVWDTVKNGFRLPTEMEWTWAAMGAADSTNDPGYTKAFAESTKNAGIGDYAWYDANSGYKTHEVGGKAANELGLRDMSGNVWEWCWDWYGDYPAGEQTDYTGPNQGLYRVIRGGGWFNFASYCTLATRNYAGPELRNYDLGFRVVCF
jgi:formylglycine-generating enzyme required for sulfatase activity